METLTDLPFVVPHAIVGGTEKKEEAGWTEFPQHR